MTTEDSDLDPTTPIIPGATLPDKDASSNKLRQEGHTSIKNITDLLHDAREQSTYWAARVADLELCHDSIQNMLTTLDASKPTASVTRSHKKKEVVPDAN